MQTGIAEIVGVFLVIVGCAGFVAAASLISVALAVAVAAAFFLLGGILLVYIAAQVDRARKAAPKTSAHGDRG
jgi:membrane protein implicated in regulation of membrane protease activity